MALELTEEQVKAGWTVQKLGDVANIVMGQSPRGENVNNNAIGMPLLNGPTEFTSYYPVPVKWTEQITKLAEKNDILFCVRGSTTGRMNIADQSYVIGRGLAAVRGKKKVDTRYIYFLIQLYLPEWLNVATGSTFPNISGAQLNEFEIAWPPEIERTRITEILGSLDDKIEANNTLLNSLDEYLRLDYVASIKQDKDLRTVSNIAAEVREGVSAQEIDESDVYVGLEHLPRRNVWLSSWGNGSEVTSNKSRFKKGDILFGKLRPYFHKVVVAPVDGVCSTDIIVVRPKPGFEQLALQVLSSDAVIEYATNVSNGTRMPRAKWSDLKKYEFVVAQQDVLLHMNLPRNLILENRRLTEIRNLLIRNLIR